jgi:hypothetical protein
VLGIDQKQLVGMSQVSQLATQRTKASERNVRGIVNTPSKVIECAGIDFIGENASSEGRTRSPLSAPSRITRRQRLLIKSKNYGTATAGPRMIPPLKRHKKG